MQPYQRIGDNVPAWQGTQHMSRSVPPSTGYVARDASNAILNEPSIRQQAMCTTFNLPPDGPVRVRRTNAFVIIPGGNDLYARTHRAGLPRFVCNRQVPGRGV